MGWVLLEFYGYTPTTESRAWVLVQQGRKKSKFQLTIPSYLHAVFKGDRHAGGRQKSLPELGTPCCSLVFKRVYSSFCKTVEKLNESANAENYDHPEWVKVDSRPLNALLWVG